MSPEQIQFLEQSHIERIKDLGAEFERNPAERVVITGYKAITPFGDEVETFKNLLLGNSAIRELSVDNWRTNIGAPIDFDPNSFYSEKELRAMSRVVAVTDSVVRQAALNANLLDESGKIDSRIASRKRVAIWIGAGVGPSEYLIDIDRSIRSQTDDQGNLDLNAGSRKIDTFAGLKTFPQDMAGRPAISIGASGWGGSTVEACATGASNIIEGYRLIKDGYADVVIAGGFEDVLASHPEVAIGIFAKMRITSARNESPSASSRPFDSERDGFILGSGGAVVVLERLDHALNRNAPIYSEMIGGFKSTDGSHPTSLDPENVAVTIAQALYDKKSKSLIKPDAIFAHATSTREGDKLEVLSLRHVFGQELRYIPISAIKSMLGHLLGGAGAVNILTAIQSINSGRIPPIANLENPDPDFADLSFVREKYLEKDLNTALALAYGFGGFNAVATLAKYKA